MRLQEGPAFSALIIGSGVGFLTYQKTQSPFLSLVIGLGVAMVDYVVLVFVKNITRK